MSLLIQISQRLSIAATATIFLSFMPAAFAQGMCGSADRERFAIPDFVCFGYEGIVLPWAICAAAGVAGHKAVHFGQACKEHDACYGSPGSSKYYCDKNFGSLLKATCDETLDGRFRALALLSCRSAASVFFTAVNSFGCDPYLKAQARAGVKVPTCTSVDSFIGKWTGYAVAGSVKIAYGLDVRGTADHQSATVSLQRSSPLESAKYLASVTIIGSELGFKGVGFIERSGDNFCLAIGKLQLSLKNDVEILSGTWGPADSPGGCPAGSGGEVYLSRDKR